MISQSQLGCHESVRLLLAVDGTPQSIALRIRAGATHVDGMRRVAIVYDPSRSWDLEVVTGIADRLNGESNCLLSLKSVLPGRFATDDVRSWQADLVVGSLDHPGHAASLLRSGTPVVGFGEGRFAGSGPRPVLYVHPDNCLVAAASVEHLLEQGFRHLAYYQRTVGVACASERRICAEAYALSRGLPLHVFRRGTGSARDTWASAAGEDAELMRWLQGLPKSVGIITPSDADARAVLEACLRSGVDVPKSVGVIGAGNDQWICRISRPDITSVDTAASTIGHAVAAAVGLLLAGEVVSSPTLSIGPRGVIERRSTDALAADDSLVAAAMAFIRDQAHRTLGVADVARAVAVSRSKLEVRFRWVVKSTVAEAIRRAHLRRARRLTLETSLPLKQVAHESGFKTVQHLTTCFLKSFGQTPARYRRSMKVSECYHRSPLNLDT